MVAAITALTAQQIAGLTATIFQALTPTQIAALSVTNFSALDATQIGSLTTTQLRGVTATQIGGFSTTDVAELTSTQVVQRDRGRDHGVEDAFGIGVAGQVEPMPAPALAVARTGEQAVHQLGEW